MDEKTRAHLSISVAVKRGFIPRASDLCCADCGEDAAIYHHPNGYDDTHRFDVVPLCYPCHRIRHHGPFPTPTPELTELARRMEAYRRPDGAGA